MLAAVLLLLPTAWACFCPITLFAPSSCGCSSGGGYAQPPQYASYGGSYAAAPQQYPSYGGGGYGGYQQQQQRPQYAPDPSAARFVFYPQPIYQRPMSTGYGGYPVRAPPAPLAPPPRPIYRPSPPPTPTIETYVGPAAPVAQRISHVTYTEEQPQVSIPAVAEVQPTLVTNAPTVEEEYDAVVEDLETTTTGVVVETTSTWGREETGTTRIVPIQRKEGDGRSDDFEYFYVYYDDDGKKQTKTKKVNQEEDATVIEDSEVETVGSDYSVDDSPDTVDGRRILRNQGEVKGAVHLTSGAVVRNPQPAAPVRKLESSTSATVTTTNNVFDYEDDVTTQTPESVSTDAPAGDQSYEEYEVEEMVPVFPDGTEGKPHYRRLDNGNEAPIEPHSFSTKEEIDNNRVEVVEVATFQPTSQSTTTQAPPTHSPATQASPTPAAQPATTEAPETYEEETEPESTTFPTIHIEQVVMTTPAQLPQTASNHPTLVMEEQTEVPQAGSVTEETDVTEKEEPYETTYSKETDASNTGYKLHGSKTLIISP